MDYGYRGSHVVIHRDRIEFFDKNYEPDIYYSELDISELKNDEMICGFALGVEEYFNKKISSKQYGSHLYNKNYVRLFYINGAVHILMRKKTDEMIAFENPHKTICWD